MGAVIGFVVAFLITLLGFWSSFFSHPAGNDIWHMVHGLFATGWMIMLIAQSALMAAGQVKLHHLVGRVSMAWVVVLLITAVHMVQVMLSTQGGFLSAEMRLSLGYIDVLSLLMFAGFYVSAIVCAFRRVIDHHMRLMGCTVLITLIPALGRAITFYVPGVQGFGEALPLTFLCLEGACLGLMAYDFVKVGRVYPAYAIAFAGLVLIHLTMFKAPSIPPYLIIARGLGYPG